MKLWEHQRKAIDKARDLDHLALLMGLGTGKSLTAINIMMDKFKRHGRVLKTLIIAPSSVVPNWKNEFKKFAPEYLRNIKVLDGTLKDRAASYMFDGPGIYVTNCEAMAFPIFSEAVVLNPPEMLVVDEVHRFKGMDAKRTKALIKARLNMERKPIHYSFVLTGSPVLNDELDIFSQFLIMDAGRTFGTNYYVFRSIYFNSVIRKINAYKNFTEWKVKKGSAELIKEKMAPLCVLAKKEECLDLPPFIQLDVEVKMSKEQDKAYNQMKKDLIAFLDSGTAVAQLALTKALRLQQILSGFLKLDDGSIHRFLDNPRIRILSDLLEDIVPSEKVIIWAVFKEDHLTIENVVKKLDFGYAMVTGDVKDKQEALNRFETDPKCRVMIASQSAGGTGINMIQASTAIYYSKNFSLEQDMQSEARNYRGGSDIHKKITRIDLVCRETMDDIILTALKSKKDLSSQILDLKALLR